MAITTTIPTSTETPFAGETRVASGSDQVELFRVEGLRVSFGTRRSRTTVVEDVSLSLSSGRSLALVGESGSGKTVTARSLLGLNMNAHVEADRLDVLGRDARQFGERAWRRIRGGEAGYVLQDALVSLDPLRTVGAEIEEVLKVHRFGSRGARLERVLDSLDRAGVPEPDLRRRQRSGELSGGLRQRALIAQAIALRPRLLIADEPTTALDVTVQAQILDLLDQLKQDGTGVLLISHDLAVVGRVAEEIAVMQAGRVVEVGSTEQVLLDPQHPYTKRLLAAVPGAHPRGSRLSATPPTQVTARAERAPHTEARPQLDASAPALEARGLMKHYRGPDGTRRRVLDRVDFTLRRGTTLGIVGESGSGKSTAARIALGLVTPDAGEVTLAGRAWAPGRERDRRALRPEIQVVHQDPLSSFDPRHTVRRIVLDALDAGGHPRADRTERAIELLDQVGLAPEFGPRVPLTLSGGQRQRVAIARALALDPQVLVLDEPVSALDVSIQAQVLDLLSDLQQQLGLSYLFISHDLGVVHHLADEVVVLKDGCVVETGPVDEVFRNPHHDYTRQLLDSIIELPQKETNR
jgi:peptide/nickel transport system ATP-binding protein